MDGRNIKTNTLRLHGIGELPADIRIRRAELDGDRLRLCFAPDRHRAGSIRSPGCDATVTTAPRRPGWLAPGLQTWDGGLNVGLYDADFDALRRC